MVKVKTQLMLILDTQMHNTGILQHRYYFGKHFMGSPWLKLPPMPQLIGVTADMIPVPFVGISSTVNTKRSGRTVAGRISVSNMMNAVALY